MKGNNEHMDRIFREKLGAYSEQPPAEVWEGISTGITSRGKRKSLFFWLAAAAGLTALAGAILLVNREQTGEPFLQQQVTEESSVQGDEAGSDIKEETDIGESTETNIQTDKQIITEITVDEAGDETGSESAAVSGFQKDKEFTPEHAVELDPINARSTLIFPTGFDITGASRPYLSDDQFQPGTGYVETSKGFDAEELKANQQRNKWTIGTQAAPLYAYRNLEPGSRETVYAQADAGSLNRCESAILSYSGGINVQYHTVRRLTLQSGLYFSRMGMRLDFEDVAVKSIEAVPSFGTPESANSTGTLSYDIQTGSGTELATSWQEYNNQTPGTIDNAGGMRDAPSSWDLLQYLDYFEIPLVLKYKMIDRKIGISLVSGLSSQILIGNEIYLADGEQREKVGETADIRDLNYSGIFGLGLEYKLAKGWAISLEPSFKYYLNPVNTTGIYNSHPWNFGIYTGISYTIR